jgi:hypothetical protein
VKQCFRRSRGTVGAESKYPLVSEVLEEDKACDAADDPEAQLVSKHMK